MEPITFNYISGIDAMTPDDASSTLQAVAFSAASPTLQYKDNGITLFTNDSSAPPQQQASMQAHNDGQRPYTKDVHRSLILRAAAALRLDPDFKNASEADFKKALSNRYSFYGMDNLFFADRQDVAPADASKAWMNGVLNEAWELAAGDYPKQVQQIMSSLPAPDRLEIDTRINNWINSRLFKPNNKPLEGEDAPTSIAQRNPQLAKEIASLMRDEMSVRLADSLKQALLLNPDMSWAQRQQFMRDTYQSLMPSVANDILENEGDQLAAWHARREKEQDRFAAMLNQMQAADAPQREQLEALRRQQQPVQKPQAAPRAEAPKAPAIAIDTPYAATVGRVSAKKQENAAFCKEDAPELLVVPQEFYDKVRSDLGASDNEVVNATVNGVTALIVPGSVSKPCMNPKFFRAAYASKVRKMTKEQMRQAAAGTKLNIKFTKRTKSE